ncbi:MAG: hypothetical protein H7Y31_07440 [Chitinophagaceae bacterium]|nr:hypothetical protein [Chitinophagaceae bacterium]
MTGIDEWNLLLTTDATTNRDGPFNGSTNYPGTWFFRSATAHNKTEIVLPGDPTLANKQPAKSTEKGLDKKIATINTATGLYAFNTTNFDDGWTSTIHEDWVQVAKGGHKVLIHYPNKKADQYSADLLGGLKNAWDVLVAPRYSSARNMEFKPIYGWQSIEFAESDLIDIASGQPVYVVLFKFNYSGGGGRYLEIISSSKPAYEQEFGVYKKEGSGWDKLSGMANYNKFAVAASDLSGKWSSDYSSTVQYVNAVTGNDAGMDSHASNENFLFGAGNSYKWDLGVASGRVGAIKFQSVRSSGQFSLKDNWHLTFSDLEGKPRTSDVHFTCIKGQRILWLDGKSFGRVD